MNYFITVNTGRKIHTIDLKPGDTVTAGDADNDTLLISGSGLGAAYLVLACDAGGVRILSRQPMQFGDESTSSRVLSAGESIAITPKITLAVFEARPPLNSELPLEGFDELRIGRSYNKNDICLKAPTVSGTHALLKRSGGKWLISDLESRNGTFVNDSLAPVGVDVPAENVSVFICGYVFSIHDDTLRFTNTSGDIEFAPDVADSLVPMPARQKAYPFFTRSPRIRNRAEKAEFELASPPNAGTKPTISWFTVMLPPVMMVTVMSFVAFMTKNFNMLMYSVPMSMMSVILSLVNNKNNMKKWLKNNGLALEKYSGYLSEMEQKITDAEGAFISSLSMSSPGPGECLAVAQNVSRRLWERSPEDNDFLNLRVGTGSMPSNVKLRIPTAQMALEDNPLIRQAQEIKSRHTTLNGVPVCHSLLDYPITGLVGRKDAVVNTVWRMIMDIAVHHSYKDVKIICIYPEEDRAKWEWIRWLPHIWDDKHKERCLACTENEARTILQKAAETMTQRRRGIKPGSRDTAPAMPFYVLILADRTLTEMSGEQFLPENIALGFAVIYAYGDISSLPGKCQSVIFCEAPASIQNTQPDRSSLTLSFTPDKVSVNMLDDFARALAPVQLVAEGGGSRMPSSISFLQGVGAKTIEDLNVMGRWKKSNPTKTLAAPMGIMRNGNTFNFNIIDSSIKGSGGMGPHGMTVGTTGSGKTETLTTLLLSIALTYSPEDVNFALIEFKGASLSTVLHPLPHIAGIITNLDDPLSTVRGLRSVKGEMMRRQRIFAKIKDMTTQDLPTYMKHRKIHPELEPLPYLLVVIDEFAEFIDKFKDFQNDVISIARTGRSMGIYMILTMQSPEGVVKGDVMTNLRFRICMRTASAADSKLILGTEDAYRLSVPGRTIVKVGSDDNANADTKPIYEHIQTFYSKAPYMLGTGPKMSVNNIRLVSLNGKKETLKDRKKKIAGSVNEPEKEEKKPAEEEKTQGTLVVESIARTAREHNLRHAIPVWKDPLPETLVLDGLIAGHEAFDREAKTWSSKNRGLSVIAGLVDAPEDQIQYPFALNFMKEGHQILYGSPSSGKTTFLQTVIFSAAMTYTPEQVNFVILDYGSDILKSTFESLPHTIIAAGADDTSNVKKANDFLLSELDTRRKMFAEKGVMNLEAYRAAVGKPVPAIIVVVDNIASLNSQSSEMIATITKVASDGSSRGIFLMITAYDNSGAFIYKISQKVISRHTLQMTEKTDYRQITGSAIGIYPSNFKGRGLKQGGLEYQTALCMDVAVDKSGLEDADDDDIRNMLEAERSRKLKALCADMAQAWTGKSASLESAESEVAAPIQAGELTSSENGVQIGMKKGTREPVEFVYSEMNGCVISGTLGGGKSSILGMIAQALDKDSDTTLYVYEQNTVIETFCPNAKSMHNPSEADKVIAKLAEEFDNRTYDDKRRIVFCIDDFYNFYQDITQDSADILEAIAERGAAKGIYLYICCSSKGLSILGSSNTPILQKLLAKGNAIIAGGSIGEYVAFKSMHQSGNLSFRNFEGCMIHKNKVTELRFGQPKGGRLTANKNL